MIGYPLLNELDWMIEGMRRKYVWKTILVEGITGICHWNRYDGIGGQYGIQSNGDGAGGLFRACYPAVAYAV